MNRAALRRDWYLFRELATDKSLEPSASQWCWQQVKRIEAALGGEA